MKHQHAIFDCEIIGTKKPVFLTGVKVIETGKTYPFWLHKRGHMKSLRNMLEDECNIFVGFNSENFDRPLIAAAMMGYEADSIKIIATTIIERKMRSWQTYKEFNLDFMEYDHIDLYDVAPGPMVSLKTYAGRMGYPTMVDMPIHHDHDCNAKEQKIIEDYCLNDLGVTECLYNTLNKELDLRVAMSIEYDIDLRSKSDAQIAEAILKKTVGISSSKKIIPPYVMYTAPHFIQTKNPKIAALNQELEEATFQINYGNGSPIEPDFLAEAREFGGHGTYKVGLGGLHSLHDVKFFLEESEDLKIVDIDAASYYPKTMIEAGFIPHLAGGKGEKFLEEYKKIYETRIAAKNAGDKSTANSLKIVLNGTFGKLGSMFCSFYSPDLLLGVTITGQLNLLCLIDEIEKIKGVKVLSANTDGIMVAYKPIQRDKLMKVVATNSKRTGYSYEETPYKKVAIKDVNNYFAVKMDGSVKRKGLYGEHGVNPVGSPTGKNPTMEVCSLMAAEYLSHGVKPEVSIKKYTDMKDFVEIRNVKGGGIQYEKYTKVDDWVEIEKGVWRRPDWPSLKASVKRKSRPPAVDVGVGGKPFGRVARWYKTTATLPPLSYIGSGNKVPDTDGARACLTLPKTLPKDLNTQWYIDETYRILSDCGVNFA